MIDLDKRERALLDLARDAHDPSAADRVRVRDSLAARLGAVAGLGMAAGLGSSAKAATAAGAAGGLGAGATGGSVVGGALAVKLIGAAMIAASAVGAAAVHRAHHRAPVAAITASARSGALRPQAPAAPPLEGPPPAVAPDERTDRPASPGETCAPPQKRGGTAAPTQATGGGPQAALPMARSDRGEEALGRPPDRPRRSAGSTAPSASPTDSSLPSLPTLGDEARLFQEGVAALRAGQPARALALFDGHALIYPGGALAEERAAERALALAELGRAADAHAAAQEFLRAHPASPLAARLRERLRELDVQRQEPPAAPANARPSR